jgi:uncharacterized protein YecT (DUF1311 family)
MAQAGRARIAYLRAYGSPSAGPAPTQAVPQPAQISTPTAASAAAPARIGPSFDCSKGTHPLALMICGNPELTRTDLEFVQAYQALRHQVGEPGQRELQQEAIDFTNSVLRDCGVPEIGPVSGSPDCVGAHYKRQRSYWLARLSGAPYEEADRPIERHVALQSRLQQLGFLPPTERVDGVYSARMRGAIVAWQNATGRPVSGFLGDTDASVLERGASQQVAEAESPDRVAPTSPPQSTQTSDNIAARAPAAMPAQPYDRVLPHAQPTADT